MASRSDSLDLSLSSRLGFHIALLMALSIVVLLLALFTVGG